MVQIVTQSRADPKRMRDEYKSNLSADEFEKAGLNYGAGGDHPRAWVGPPFLYDLIGAMQFQLLIELGMRDYHRFLDIGCGSLRLGRLAIMYLLSGRYFGVEPNKKMLEEGVKLHFGSDQSHSQVLHLKAPIFAYNSDFDFGFTGGPVDFVFGQSIASHTGPELTLRLLRAIASVCHDRTIAMVTYIRCLNPAKSNRREGWFYPECVSYTDSAFGELARQSGLYAYRAAWPPLNIRADGLVTSQQPTILSKEPWAPNLAQRMTAALFDGVVKIN